MKNPNTELLKINSEKHEHSKRIEPLIVDTTYSEWKIVRIIPNEIKN